MLAGLFVAIAICAPLTQPGLVPDAHKDAVARFGAAMWNLRRDRLLTAAKQLDGTLTTDRIIVGKSGIVPPDCHSLQKFTRS